MILCKQTAMQTSALLASLHLLITYGVMESTVFHS